MAVDGYYFKYKPHNEYLRARDFLAREVPFTFNYWTHATQEHMDVHLVHVGGDRTTREIVWTGKDNHLYLADFETAWKDFFSNLTPYYQERFRDHIDQRLNSEFRHCGDLGKQFVL